jgi:hypothetical protein
MTTRPHYRLGDTVRNGIRVTSSRVPSVPEWQHPNLDAQPWTDEQKLSISKRMRTALSGPTFLNRNLSLFNPPADSLPFIVTPSVFPAYPAVAAAPIVVIEYQVQPGMLAVITRLAIVDNGANTIGNGNILWSVLINGGAIDGLGNLTMPIGTLAQPNDVVFVAHEQDIIQVTVQVTTGAAAGTTAAMFQGWTYPLSQATSVNQQGGPLQ